MAERPPLLFQVRLGMLEACEQSVILLENQRLDGCSNTAPSLTITSDRSARMASSQLPSPDELRQLLHYDPETGDFIWKSRPEAMFRPSEGAVRRTAAWSANKWNTRYAGQPALIKRRAGGYLCGSIFNVVVAAHRVAWALHYGEWPKGEIDHINGDPSDNRIANLRDVSHSENMRNQRRYRNCRSGVTGVSWYAANKRWVAEMQHEGKRLALGSFSSFDEAVTARKEAERRLGFHENHGSAR